MTIYSPTETVDIPTLDFLSVLFGNDVCYTTEDRVIHAEADDLSISVTKAQARSWTKRITHLLRTQYGVGKDGPGKDVIGVFATGSVALPILFYSIIGAGGIYSAASIAYTPSELARQLKGGSANLLICSADLLDGAMAAAKECGIPPDRVLIIGSRPNINFRTALGQDIPIPKTELQWTKITNLSTLSTLPICLLYSSGTTGLPKGVIITHRMLVAAAVPAVISSKKWDADQQAQGVPPFKFNGVAHLPSSHIAGVQGQFINPIMANGTMYWMPRFELAKFLEYNKTHKTEWLLTVPPIWLLILKTPGVTDQFATLRMAMSGAAPFGIESQKAVGKKLGKATGQETYVRQTWGLTETCGSATWVPNNAKDDSGSVGWLFPNVSARIVDDQGNDVPKGERGEIWIKGPITSPGYHNNPIATQEGYHGEWLRTGDIGFFRDDRFFCVDRKKELIKYKGNQVAPAELEALLITHPQIVDAAVIGVEGEDTELPRAYVVADKSKISEQEIKDFVKKNLAQYKQLRGGVRFVESIPKIPSGKILRRELREQAKLEKRRTSKL